MKFKIITYIVLFSILAACGSTTKMTATWRASDQGASFKKIAVIGIAKNADARKIVEGLVEQKLIAAGIKAVAALEFLPPNATKDNIPPEVVKQLLLVEGFDAVLTISLLGKEDTRRYVPGSVVYAPYYGTSFYDYYGQMNNYMYSTGYTTGSVYFFLESNIFKYPGGELVWSGQSESYDVTDLENSAEMFSSVLVKEIIGSKVLVP